MENETVFINRYFIKNPSHVIGEFGIVEAYGRPELSCRSSGKTDTIDRLRQHLAHFPPKKLPTLEECKIQLVQRLSMIDKQMRALLQTRNQLIRAQSDLQLMEQKFLKDCMATVSMDHLFDQAPL